MLGRENVLFTLGTIEDVTRRGHGVQPLAEIAGAESGPRGECVDGDRPHVGERLEEAEAVTDEAERAQERGPDVRDDLSEELLRLRTVEPCRHAILRGVRAL